MKTSSYFDEALFYRQSPTANEFFDEKSSTLFELDENRASIEIFVQGETKSQDVTEKYILLSKSDAEPDWHPEEPSNTQSHARQDDAMMCGSYVALQVKALSNVEMLRKAALVRICN